MRLLIIQKKLTVRWNFDINGLECERYFVEYMEISANKFYTLSIEKKKEWNDETDAGSHKYDVIGFSIGPDRLL